MPILSEIDSNISAFESLEICSDEEDYDTGIKQHRQRLYFDDDSDDEEESYASENEEDGLDNDVNEKENLTVKEKRTVATVKNNGSKQTKNSKKKPIPQPRKRRRSSARFLRLSGRFDDDEDREDLIGGNGDELVGGETAEEKQVKLGEMYRRAIRLNAENKINVGNSWGLNLIDNIDKFICDDNGDDDVVVDAQKELNVDPNGSKRVNFTKASCTLDASVKIYSYRVDDVHLTSYKVLANLNRSDGGKDKNHDLFNDGGVARGDDEQNDRLSIVNEAKRSAKQSAVQTIETNLSNINVSKLDAAYDIDPIFHKMSQKFDEGGAKGLLLVNLGVASNGCRIVLDSKEGEEEDHVDNGEMKDDNTEMAAVEEGEIDISELKSKLQELLICSPLETIQLVPQLEELRDSYAALEAEGFSDQRIAKKMNSKRYANDEDEEKAAEDSIRRDALERSRASGLQSTSILAPNMSMFSTGMNKFTSPDDEEYASDDYDGGFDDYDDPEFDNFIAADDNAEKYASASFIAHEMHESDKPPSLSTEKSVKVDFLDEICNNGALHTNGEYNFFDAKALDSIMTGNQWAGSTHWKKRERLRVKPKTSVAKSPSDKRNDQKRKKKKDTNNTKTKSLIDLNSCHECLDRLLKDNKKSKGKKNDPDASQFTKAIMQKHSKEKNILPYDAEMSTKQFSTLFMRPGAVVSEFAAKRSVGFHDEYNTPFDDGVDDSYDEGPGFDIVENEDGGNFAELDDFVVNDLEDVRKVDKVRVKHATVAKKVDVKRLKQDLWKEVDVKTNSELAVDSQEDDVNDMSIERAKNVSFQTVVKDIEHQETQEDVSLAFYFICILHLANEKCLKLENGEHGLNDFIISRDQE